MFVRVRTVVVLLIVALIAGSTGMARDDPAPSPGSADALTVVHREMKKIQNQIKNAKARLVNGVQSMDESSGSVPSTPARACCSFNLERLNKRVMALVASLKQLDACYAGSDQGASRAQLGIVKEDLDAFVRALKSFAEASRPGDTHAFLAGTTRAFILLRDSIGELESCPPDGQMSPV